MSSALPTVCYWAPKHEAPSLRQLASANKAVVIDECHAYDVYTEASQRASSMARYWRVPVIILLSATLPTSQRNEMIDKYLEGWRLSVTLAGEAQPKSENDGPFQARTATHIPHHQFIYSNGDTEKHRNQAVRRVSR